MSSLVAYEDSESEDEASSSVQTEGCKQNQEAIACNDDAVETPRSRNSAEKTKTLEFHGYIPETSIHFQSQSNFGWERKHCLFEAQDDKRFQNTAATLSLPEPQGKITPRQAFPGQPHESNPAKRQSSGVRPYIPKRQRLTTSVDTVDLHRSAEQVVGSPNKESQILSEVSGRLKPFLNQKPSAAGIPRRLMMSLEGHQGPVNTMQWCPVPHLSHLLLSASMDKTFKVWDGAESGRCLRVYTCHSGAVRDACWTPCGRRLLTASFDNTAVITDVETGQPAVKLDNQFKLMCVALHPSNPEVFLCGGYSSAVKAWDSRSCKVVKVYKAGIQQTLDILFLRGGVDFMTSSDCVSRDSADRTLMAWDFQTTARLSNQIYQERYTCPSLTLHPLEECFVAQTNGNYMASFSSQKPYRMNKRRRFEGHKVEGYAVQCEFSADGSILASGSSTGSAHFYDYQSGRLLHALKAHSQPCLSAAQHPLLPATTATCDWAGEIKVWH